MARKILRDFFLLLGLLILGISTSRKAMAYLVGQRDNNKWWGKYDWRYGNLSGMSRLEIINKFRTSEDYTRKKTLARVPKNISLVLRGDSFTRHPQLRDTDFVGVAKFNFADEFGTYCFSRDSSKKNILIIEIAENSVRDYFREMKIRREIVPPSAQGTFDQTALLSQPPPVLASFSVNGSLFNKFINQNLEYNLFNYNLISPAISSKAALNYYLFHRASGDVIISNDGEFLLFKKTVVKEGSNSSYSVLGNDELSAIITDLNNIYNYYRSIGFDEIYLSIMPNTASIIQPEGYNGLIPRIQNDPSLRMKVIDVYTVFKTDKGNDCLRGDTHWNNNGFNKWLDIVNAQLEKENTK
jgi:hypothetical protein